MLGGPERRLGPIADLQFAEDLADMIADGAFAEVKSFGNFAIAMALADQLQDLAFAIAEGLGDKRLCRQYRLRFGGTARVNLGVDLGENLGGDRRTQLAVTLMEGADCTG